MFLLWYNAKTKTEMTTLLQEFEEWLRLEYERTGDGDIAEFVLKGLNKLEELKKKHNVV